jgi:class 3 adenylate cyclase
MTEFRRRPERRQWATLISIMLPPTVVAQLQDNNSNSDSSADATPTTLAWNLPHTCIFQSDIVGFTALTQRIAPHQLVAMLHGLFAVRLGSCCPPHRPTHSEPLFAESNGIL